MWVPSRQVGGGIVHPEPVLLWGAGGCRSETPLEPALSGVGVHRVGRLDVGLDRGRSLALKHSRGQFHLILAGIFLHYHLLLYVPYLPNALEL